MFKSELIWARTYRRFCYFFFGFAHRPVAVSQIRFPQQPLAHDSPSWPQCPCFFFCASAAYGAKRASNPPAATTAIDLTIDRREESPASIFVSSSNRASPIPDVLLLVVDSLVPCFLRH